MKTYTLFLDTIVIFLLALAVNFQLSDDYIANHHVSRAGITRTMIISSQSLVFFAGFCLLLRFVGNKIARESGS